MRSLLILVQSSRCNPSAATVEQMMPDAVGHSQVNGLHYSYAVDRWVGGVWLLSDEERHRTPVT
jgi:hypothetical protein